MINISVFDIVALPFDALQLDLSHLYFCYRHHTLGSEEDGLFDCIVNVSKKDWYPHILLYLLRWKMIDLGNK